MTNDDLRSHLADILLCCGVPAAQINTAAVDRLRLATTHAAHAERKALLDNLRAAVPKIRTIDCLMNVRKVERLRVVRDYLQSIIRDIESRTD